MRNIINKVDNVSLISTRQESTFDFQHVFISKQLIDINSISLQTKEISYCFPLYLYPETSGQQTIGQTAERTPNLNLEIVNQIAEKLGLSFTPEKDGAAVKENASPVCYAQSDEIRAEFKELDAETTPNTFVPIDILDYIYAVLHSPSYREKYKEFLKIDFPRVPYPKDATIFWQLVKLGGEIRQIHLLESPKVEQYITSYPQDGSNTVTRSIGKKDWELVGENTNKGAEPINTEKDTSGRDCCTTKKAEKKL